MILRRLATALRKQDWVTVLIETLIVVLGVFLGIQLGNWNEARAERARGEQLVERLYEELTTSLETEQACTVRMENYFATARDASEMLRTGELGEGGEAAFREQFLKIGPWTDLCIIRSTLDELQSGRIALVRDERLKRLILQFHEDVDGVDTSMANLGSVTMDTMQVLSGELDYAWSGETRRLVTPFEDMSANPAVVRNTETMTLVLSEQLRYHRWFDVKLRAMQQALAEYLGKDAR